MAICTQEQGSATIEEKILTSNDILSIEQKVYSQSGTEVDNLEQKMYSKLVIEINNLEERLQMQKENLQFKIHYTDRWLTAIAIFFTLITIIVTIAIFTIHKSIKEENQKELQEMRNKIDKEIEFVERRANSLITYLESAKKTADKLVTEIKIKLDSTIEQAFPKNIIINEFSKEEEKISIREEKAEYDKLLNELKQIQPTNEFEAQLVSVLNDYLSKNYHNAINILQQLLKQKQNITGEQLVNLYYYVAFIQTRNKQYEESNEYYDKFIAINPENGDAYNSKGLNYIYMAKNEYNKNKTNSIRYYNQAKKMFKKAIEIEKKEWQAYYNLSYVFIELGKEESNITEKKRLFRAAYKCNKKITFFQYDNLYAHDRMGCALGYLADVEKAQGNMDKYSRLLNKALKKTRFAAEAGGRCYNHACNLALKGKKKQAFKWLEEALKRNYVDFDWIKNDPDWDDYRDEEKYIELQRKFTEHTVALEDVAE